MKTKWEGRFFFEKNLRVQFDVVFDSESYGVIFDSLAPFGGELRRFVILKFVRQLQPTQIFFLEFLSRTGRLKNSTCTGYSCRTNLRFINRHNSPPNGARESKITPYDSESKTSNYFIL